MAMIRTCDNCEKEITPFSYVQISDYGVGGTGGGTTDLCADCAAPALNIKAVKDSLKKDRDRRRSPTATPEQLVGAPEAASE